MAIKFDEDNFTTHRKTLEEGQARYKPDRKREKEAKNTRKEF